MTTQHTPDASIPASPHRLPAPRSGGDHLEVLLGRRRAAAITAVEAMSHYSPHASDLTHEVLRAEDVIREQYPEVYERQLEDWITSDGTLLHTPEFPSPTCQRCGQAVSDVA